MTDEWIGTYRLQLHAGFTLRDAERILAYLAELGVSHVYLSPCLQAFPGSMHGYDVTDPARISEDLGGEAAWKSFVAAARAQHLGILLDFVPNHMSTSEHNAWWDDVLAHGPYSEFAGYFDIRTAPHEPFRVHICTLAHAYGEALEKGELVIESRGGRPRIAHFDNTWPLSAASWGTLLDDLDPCFADLIGLQGVVAPSDADRARHRREIERAEAVLAEAAAAGRLAAAIERTREDPSRLDAILRRQFFALHSWKLAGELTNYRRFFDVSGLVGLKVEMPAVFETAHARVEGMIRQGQLDGLRLDHPDGLRDPLGYFERLRASLPEGRLYVEKILENDERLPEDWPIDGTVGYEFMAKVNRLWMDDRRIDAFTGTYADFTGHTVNFAALVRAKKREIVESTFSADLDRLSAAALNIARADWRTRDLSPRRLREALASITTALGVYRTYRTAAVLNPRDERVFTEAVQSARMSAPPNSGGSAFDFPAALFSKPKLDAAAEELIARWQQLTPAVTAKGVEDTTFYLFDRLVSCNEVGSQASLMGISAEEFHEFCHYLSEHWPRNMLATSTHDNKRSEDVRTRISLLSEIPDRWAAALHQWSTMNEGAWNNRTPDRHAEYLLYQTLVGAWPIDAARSWQYMLKACREAKLRTSWQEPNAGYEANIQGFVERALDNVDFVLSLTEFVEPLVLPGRINSLAQTLIKLVAPGVPDFYQGSELWDLSLVDPDNRRPVDYEKRAELLARCRSVDAAQALAQWDSGLPKLWLIDKVLSLRAARPEQFAEDSRYQPLAAQGAHLGNLFAFRRGENLIAVVPRLTLSIANQWEDTRLPLPSGTWKNVFTAEDLSVSATPNDLFQHFPVALLLKQLG